jgi:hypothetical protein
VTERDSATLVDGTEARRTKSLWPEGHPNDDIRVKKDVRPRPTAAGEIDRSLVAGSCGRWGRFSGRSFGARIQIARLVPRRTQRSRSPTSGPRAGREGETHGTRSRAARTSRQTSPPLCGGLVGETRKSVVTSGRARNRLIGVCVFARCSRCGAAD